MVKFTIGHTAQQTGLIWGALGLITSIAAIAVLAL